MTPQPPYVPGPAQPGVSRTGPDEPFTLHQLATPATPKRRRRVWPLLVIAAVLAGGGAAGVWYAAARPAQPPARVVNGIPAPHPKCVTEVGDLGHPWVADGWWAGRVDGVPREMSTQAAAAAAMAGNDLDGVWICPPKRDW